MENLSKIDELTKKLESNPTDFQTRRELVVEFLLHGFNEDALKQLYYLLKRFPEDPGLHYNAGIVLENLKMFDKAIVSYQNALNIAPEEPDYLYNLGYAYLDNPTEAIPNVPLVFYSFRVMVGLGLYFILFFKENRIDDAIMLLKNALLNNPYNGDVNYTLAHLYKESGNIEQYKYHLKEAMNNHDTLSTDVKQLQLEYRSFQNLK